MRGIGRITDQQPDLGSCCACMGFKRVRNIICQPVKAPTKGNGCWGCVQCDLPSEGAVSVECDDCLESGAEILWACNGSPGDDKRVLLSDLQEPHKHDLRKHPEETARFN